MDSIRIFFFDLFQTVFAQTITLFGIFFLFGILLSAVQRATHLAYYRSLGWRGILWTAWIGTPIHELGHAFFAKLFRHKITNISLFSPNKETGGLGHVEHTFNSKSIYQRIGNFFIGAAPMICGALFLWTMLYFLLPNGKEITRLLKDASQSISAFLEIFPQVAQMLFSKVHTASWNFWLFLYISFAITAHIAPSRQDRRGMWGGFGWMILLLFLVNAILLLFGHSATRTILTIQGYLSIFTGIFIYALFLSLCHMVVANVLLLPFRKK